MRIIITTGLILGFWMLLSGHFKPLLISLGVISSLLVIWLSYRMRIIDREGYPVEKIPRLLLYQLFLIKEIIKSNIDVIFRILKPGKTISPTVIKLPTRQVSDLSKVIYANSITLTPGTVTMEITDEEITVHALSEDAAQDLAKGHIAAAIPKDKINS